MELTNDQAFEVFKEVRWGAGEEVACPVCGTIFAFHKLPLCVYLAAIAIFTNAVKGISALQLSREVHMDGAVVVQ